MHAWSREGGRLGVAHVNEELRERGRLFADFRHNVIVTSSISTRRCASTGHTHTT